MNTETTPRIMAFAASEMANLAAYRELYGVMLPVSAKPDAEHVLCLGGHHDGQSGIIRAAIAPTTVSARLLTDGRYAVSMCWSTLLRDAWETGNVQAEELTLEQLESLTTQEELP